MWGFESPPGHITKSKKKPNRIESFFIFYVKIIDNLIKLKKLKIPYF